MPGENVNNSTKDSLFVRLQTVTDTQSLGRVLHEALVQVFDIGSVVGVFLRGELGMGKTSLTQAFLQSAGHTGNAKSPTYTIVEPYELGSVQVNHFDLYRLGDPEELEFLGVRDYFELPEGMQIKQFCIVEWPEKGMGYLPIPDIDIELTYMEPGRLCKLTGESDLLELVAKLCECNDLIAGSKDKCFL